MPPQGDVRSSRPHGLTTALRSAVRRLFSITALVVLDLVGLTLGLYVALVLRGFYYGERPPLWGVLWRAETDWLPFVALITVLIFAQAGLYRHREARAGMGRVFGSLTLVAVLALAFGVGIGHEFTTFGLAPTAVITATIFVALLRGSYEIVSGELLRRAGVRRRALLVGPGREAALAAREARRRAQRHRLPVPRHCQPRTICPTGSAATATWPRSWRTPTWTR